MHRNALAVRHDRGRVRHFCHATTLTRQRYVLRAAPVHANHHSAAAMRRAASASTHWGKVDVGAEPFIEYAKMAKSRFNMLLVVTPGGGARRRGVGAVPAYVGV